MRFAVFTVSVPDYTPEEAVKALADAGYDGVEWRVIDQPPVPPDASPGFWQGNRATLPLSGLEADAPRIRKLTQKAGLDMPAIGTYAKCDEPDAVAEAMRGAVALGVPQLRVTVPRYESSLAFRPLWDQARDQYADVASLAREHGVRALLEIHHRSIVPSSSAARRFLDGLDPAHVGVIHDSGNMVFEGHEEYRLGLETLGEYLAHVHLKSAAWKRTGTRDDGGAKWEATWAPLREGVVDVGALFAALRAVGYDDWVSFEDFSQEKPLLDRIRDNLAFAKAAASQAAA